MTERSPEITDEQMAQVVYEDARGVPPGYAATLVTSSMVPKPNASEGWAEGGWRTDSGGLSLNPHGCPIVDMHLGHTMVRPLSVGS